MITQKHFITFTLSGVIIILLTMLYGYRNIQIDDSYIFYSYAQNLVNGNGYVFNPGERINGTTSPLYTLLLSLVFLIFKVLPFITLPFTGHIIGIISLFFFCFFLLKTFKTEQSFIFPYTIPIIFLLSPLLLNSIGMETFLALMLGMIAIFFYVRKSLTAFSIISSFGVLARPDMLLLVVVIVSYDFIINKRFPSLRNVIIFFIPLLIYVTINFFYFDKLIPSTISVKLNQTQSGRWGSGLIFLEGLLSTETWQGNSLFRNISIAVSASGLAVLLFKWKNWILFRHPAIHLILLWNVAYLLVYGFILNPPPYLWYYTPLSVILAVLIALTVEGIFRTSAKLLKIEPVKIYLAIIVALVFAGIARPIKLSLNPNPPKFEDYRLAAEWLNTNAKEGTSIGAYQIGVLRYYYKKGIVIDALGLVTPGVSENVRQSNYSWFIHHYQPDYLMFNHPHRTTFEAMVDSIWFMNDYALRKIIAGPSKDVAIYERLIKMEKYYSPF